MSNEELIAKYREMYELTEPECSGSCAVPRSCCDEMYCEITRRWALERYEVTLAKTDHPTLPFMGEDGCTVEPHLRPLCTLHTCAVNSLGFKPGDEEWTKKYFLLRHRIEELEC